jgi:hypothetical protein
MTRIDAEAATVAEVFGEFYVIPVFQREYIWKPRHVQTLLKDLYVAHTSGDAEDYFLGSLITYEEGGARQVVDGQQRLATLYLLLAILRDRLKKYGSGPNTQLVLENALRGVAVAKKGSHSRYRIEHTISELSQVLSTIADGRGANLPKPKTSQASYDLIRAYEICDAFIGDTFGTDAERLYAFFSFLWTDVELVDVKTVDMQQAFTVFETINFRGVTLNATDLMKNLLFKEANPSDRKVLTDRWKEMLSALRKGKENHPVRFLRYFLITRRRFDKMPTAADLFTLVSQPDVAKDLGYPTDPVGFVEEMIEAAEAYANINRGLAPDGEFNAWVDGISKQGSGVRQHLCVLLAGRHLNSEDFDLLASRIEALVLVYAVVGVQWNTIESLLPVWAPRIASIRRSSELKKFIVDEIDPLLIAQTQEFFQHLNRTDKIKPKLLRYILASLTQYLETEVGKDVELGEVLKPGITVEHIFPQNPKDQAILEFGISTSSDRKKHTYALGNLMLLHIGANSYASNDPYSEKLATYEKAATFDLSRAVFKDIDFGKKAKVSTTLKRFGLKPAEVWTPKELERRHQSLLAMVSELWDLPLES